MSIVLALLLGISLVSRVWLLLFISTDQCLDNQLDGHFVDTFYVLRVSVTKSHLHCLQERPLDSLKQC